ncbi:hypothetical protein PF008_g702 [Phytophthora fragariae]|uniref:Uncharacterized protein n=1 Tax=Phytophthora fragariae TaxID=53985 RepID=A0A6G0SP58_9STRA|nr:hypothetical protein PF008_g702 [Phytophthora fragariae]
MAPLTSLLMNASVWTWAPAPEEAFTWVMAWLSTKPVLVYPDYRSPLKLTTRVRSGDFRVGNNPILPPSHPTLLWGGLFGDKQKTSHPCALKSHPIDADWLNINRLLRKVVHFVFVSPHRKN